MRRGRIADAPEQTLQLSIESIAAGGDGVGRAGGLVVFVPRAAPGDRLVVRARQHAALARGVIERVESASPDRAEPPCGHYVHDRCGGCQLQHLQYDAQRRAKAGIIADAFARIARRPIPPPAVEPSPAPWRYRRKLTLALRRRGGGWIMGLHAYDDPDAVFALEDCPITDRSVMAVWEEIRRASGDLPEGDALRASVRLLDDGAALVVEGGRRWPNHERFAAAVPSVQVLWWERERGTRRLLLDRRAVRSPAASFVQVNPHLAPALHAHAVERVLAHRPATVVDAYAGAGDTAEPIARSGASVTAIELDAEASRWCRRRLPSGSTAIAARVEDALPAALPADVVLMNPPRAGVDARVTRTLEADGAVRAIVYVSCNPATLARDVARLPGFRVAGLRGFDMFPQTAHVETVCELIREGGGA